MPYLRSYKVLVHRYSIFILTFSGPSVGNRFALSPGVGGVREVASAIISHEQTQSNGVKPSKKISNDQELIQSDPTSCPQTKREITKYQNRQQFTKALAVNRMNSSFCCFLIFDAVFPKDLFSPYRKGSMRRLFWGYLVYISNINSSLLNWYNSGENKSSIMQIPIKCSFQGNIIYGPLKISLNWCESCSICGRDFFFRFPNVYCLVHYNLMLCKTQIC